MPFDQGKIRGSSGLGESPGAENEDEREGQGERMA